MYVCVLCPCMAYRWKRVLDGLELALLAVVMWELPDVGAGK